MNYEDDIMFLKKVVDENFPTEKYFIGINIEEFRKRNSQHQTGMYFLLSCWDNIGIDPLDRLERESEKYQLENLFSKQDINRKTFDYATEVIEILYKELQESRGIYIG
jgi:hypothetical protein